MSDRIDPRLLIAELSVAELVETAERYFQAVPDPIPLMSKPFSTPQEAVELLGKMGLILSGLRLGKGMTVLDFGAGTCWFSRFLNQVQCATISVDASQTALNYGRRLFEELPVLGGSLQSPTFVPFDGGRMEVADASVDRIVCFDAFHHIPNQQQILNEFFRVLRPGGIAGFSEPGLRHSEAPQSQYEMRHYTVLENDILLGEIRDCAEAAGFTRLTVKPVSHPELDLSYDDYVRITRNRKIPRHLSCWIVTSMQNSTVFFLAKGDYAPDSRSHLGLKHEIKLTSAGSTVEVGQPLKLSLQIKNKGEARWLHTNVRDIGVVKVGAHLYDAERKLLNLDLFRSTFDHDVLAGQTVEHHTSIAFDRPGKFILGIDLVSEHICWFENVGSQPVFVQVEVE